MANISMLEALAVGKACHARIYSYFRFKKRELLIALGSHRGVGWGGGVSISASAVPHCGADTKKTGRLTLKP